MIDIARIQADREAHGDSDVWAQVSRLIRECAEWQQAAEDTFRLACKVECELDESDGCVGLMSGMLLDAERELEEQAAEMVALRNRLDAMLGRARDAEEAAALITEGRWDAEDAAAEYHAAWQEECAKTRPSEFDMPNWRRQCLASERRLYAALDDVARLTKELAELKSWVDRTDQVALEVMRERDEALQTLDLERAAHRVTARRHAAGLDAIRLMAALND